MSQDAHPSSSAGASADFAGQETLSGNGISHAAGLSICIPAWRDTASPLLTSLASLPDHKDCEILVYDDGSADANMTRTNQYSARRL